MNNNKKTITLILILILLGIIIITGYIAYYTGKHEGIKANDVESSHNETVQKKFDLIIRRSDEKREIIPNTNLKVKEVDMQNKKIKTEYITYDENERKASIYMVRTFILEKKLGGKWYKIGSGTNRLPYTLAEGGNTNIELGKKNEEEFELSNLEKEIDLTEGIYRIVLISDASYSNSRYAMAEFEIK